jgi:predicted methyltransferase
MLQNKRPIDKTTELLKEERGLIGLREVINKGFSSVKKFFIETNAKNIALKELEINRREHIEKIEINYNKTNSYLEMKRLIDIAGEINEKYQFAVEEIEKIYGSNLAIEEKLGSFEEISSITNAYYKLIYENYEKIEITSS